MRGCVGAGMVTVSDHCSQSYTILNIVILYITYVYFRRCGI